jgi:hypothetical protein
MSVRTAEADQETALRCPHCVGDAKEWRRYYASARGGWGSWGRSPAKLFAPDGWFTGGGHHWLDHLYRLRKHDGTLLYVAEPYDLDLGDLADFQALETEGWHVAIDGCGVHHPTTLRITIWRGPL